MHEGKSCLSLVYLSLPPSLAAPSSLSTVQALQQTGLVPKQGCWCSMLLYIRVGLGAINIYSTSVRDYLL